jgi:ArsR family transcriptional regulator, arsenate/arsenite/antimonite-responsive transcriptional repressor
MGISKTEFFDLTTVEMANLLKALGHPARLAIVLHLLKVNSCICGDLVDELPLAQPTISQHLKELKQVGLIKGSIEGTSVCYCLDAEKFKVLNSFLSGIEHQLNSKNSCCE